eukprot:1609573-Pyramimonas_sp.AAC.1
MDAVALWACETTPNGVLEPFQAQLRQAGGAGAGSFLCAPESGNPAISDEAWRVALRRRLLRTVEKIAFPAHGETHCHRSGTRGSCGAQLDGLDGLVHAEACQIGGEVVGGHN